jgi:AAHS family 4-hydroxybenzoate transporter-like MFS transporter
MRVSVSAVIDDSRISPFQFQVFLLGFLVVLCDGFDTQALAYVAPVIASEWHVPLSLFGPVFAAVLLGAMLGSFVFGHVADRIGRRPALLFSVLLFAVLSLASAIADRIETLAVVRFACGIGLGSAIPNVVALVSEYAPARRRATVVAIALAGSALGAVVAGFVSLPLIAWFGWRFIFVVGGVLPLCLVPFLFAALPESIKFLAVARGDGRAVAAILRRIDPRSRFDDDSTFVLDEVRGGRGGLASLFRNGLAVGSVLLSLAFFASLLLVYLFTSWMPLLLHRAGLPLQDALMGAIVFNLSGIAGGVVCAQLIDRRVVRPMVALITAYLSGAVAVFSIGFSQGAFAPLMTAIFISGFCIIGGQLSLNAYIAAYYPTTIRGTGIGWAQVIGRLGSLLGPLVGGLLVSQGMSPPQLFQAGSVAPLLSCLALLLFAVLSRRSAAADATKTEL